MKRYYFWVEFIPSQANLPLLLGRCISIMHRFIIKHTIQGIGVSLPAWSTTSIGNKIAFVHHSESILMSLKQQTYFQDMADCGFFKLSEVCIVPEDCKEVRFKRNQSIAKIFVGESRRRLKRLEKRALARGETFSPKKSSYSRELNLFHRIPISSISNHNDFILHIQKENVDCISEPNFSGYGFASNNKFQGTVPDLSTLIEF